MMGQRIPEYQMPQLPRKAVQMMPLPQMFAQVFAQVFARVPVQMSAPSSGARRRPDHHMASALQLSRQVHIDPYAS